MSPNILFLMTDQMQARVLNPGHPCIAPNFNALANRGVRITDAYTPNPVCSPARASLMTGLLPHTHGIIQVTHCQPPDLGVLRREHPHWAQRFTKAGYRTGYFGKWHVEHSETPTDFGWQENDPAHDYTHGRTNLISERKIVGVDGYAPFSLYGVTRVPAADRFMGKTTAAAAQFLDKSLDRGQPWCCFVSVVEPHDPFICGEDAFKRYNPADIPVPENWIDDLANRPGLYRKAARAFAELSRDEKRTAAACYYAMITEIDQQFAALIQRVERAGQLDNTIIILTSDHGEMLGAHGVYTKNVGAYEEAYNIPMVLAGPDIASHGAVRARVGLHDLGSTLTDLAGIDPFTTAESRSFAPLLRNPRQHAADFTTGYAEYWGTRYWYSQRVIWDGDWKLVWNGFDFDELYNLAADPGELNNLIDDPQHQDRAKALMRRAWKIVADTNDHPLGNAGYPSLRLAPHGPNF